MIIKNIFQNYLPIQILEAENAEEEIDQSHQLINKLFLVSTTILIKPWLIYCLSIWVRLILMHFFSNFTELNTCNITNMQVDTNTKIAAFKIKYKEK